MHPASPGAQPGKVTTLVLRHPPREFRNDARLRAANMSRSGQVSDKNPDTGFLAPKPRNEAHPLRASQHSRTDRSPHD